MLKNIRLVGVQFFYKITFCENLILIKQKHVYWIQPYISNKIIR